MDANIYTVNFSAVAPILSILQRARAAKREKSNKTAWKEVEMRHQRRIPNLAHPDVPTLAHIHLRGTPSKQEGSRRKEDSESEVISLAPRGRRSRN